MRKKKKDWFEIFIYVLGITAIVVTVVAILMMALR